MQSWLEGRIWVGKGAQATGMTASLRIQSSKADSNTCESFTSSGPEAGVSAIKSHHAQMSSGKGLPSHFWTRDNVRSVLPGLWRKRTQWSKVLFSDESKFCISFGNQGPRVWRKSGEAQNSCAWRSSVKFSTVSDYLGCHVICWCWSTVFLKSTVNAAIYQEIFRAHFMLLLLLTSFMEMLISFSSRTWHLPTLPKVPKAGSMTMVLLCLIGSKLAWPETPIENLWGIVKRKMRDTRPNNADDLKATVKETWASIPPQQCHKTDHLHATPNWGSIKAKGAPTKYWVHIQ